MGQARRYNIELIEETYNQRFDELLGKLYQQTGQKVVVLIDEYDKPMLNNLKNKPVLGEIKQVMSAFYGALKSMDEYLRFVFITGVSKFAKVSIFSGMNSLDDISLDEDYRNFRYTLDFPNYEVKRSFFDSVATRYSRLEKGLGDAYIYDLVDYLNAGNLDDFFKTLKIFFANIPYELAVDREKYYQSLFYAIITMIGLSVDAEVSTNDG